MGEKVESTATVTNATAAGISEFEANPNMRLCSVLLNGFNYIPWSRAVTLALGGKSKLGFINGKNPAPDDGDPKFEEWLSKDQLVMSWILNSMEPQVAEIFSYSDSSKHLWESLKEMYGQQNNAARIFELKKEIAGAYQEGKSFIEHLGKLKGMWNELALYRPHTTDSKVLVQRAEEDKNFQLLASLDSDYEDLRRNILMSTEMPSFNNICTIIQREEIRRKVMHSETKSHTVTSESKAFVVDRRKGQRDPVKCDYCGQPRHTRNRCWILHPHLKPKNGRDINKASTQSEKAVGPHEKAAHQVTNEDSMIAATLTPAAVTSQLLQVLQKMSKPEASTSSTNSWALISQVTQLLQQMGKSQTLSLDASSASLASGPDHGEDDW
ncbi:uncharacterized protein LOC110767548 isoform X2 [Prunus avium]|uniref:Uncharacterized protein LOC110767548 isoform X2 n=1 Tax=Prunus avium TaxID=42229 RepID=A0A6P5TIA6_PRUAV|nr:uncharacterized protein LOC110767548 isoform X2 [Prunus avium]